jgi:hypothetical protein
MADQKISQLSSGTNAQAGDLFVIARGASNFNLTTAQLFNAPSAAATFASLTVDTNTLFVDAANNRVGVGTATPAGAPLHVDSGAAIAMRLTRGGGTAANLSLEWWNGTKGWYAGISTTGFWGVAYDTAGGGIDGASVRVDTSGNLGLGVTPSAWAANRICLQIGGSTSGHLAYNAATGNLTTNAFFDTTDNRYEYIGTGAATRYEQAAGVHAWYNAASGSANGAITFAQAMTLDASGNLGVGTTAPFTRLDSARARATTLNSISSFNTMAASFTDTTPYAVGVGGGINLRGEISTGSYATFAAIWAARETANLVDYRASLIFGTADNATGYPNERARITAAGSFVAGGSVALATTATDGFLYVPTCAGTPTGTPTAITGMAPIVVDTTNNKLYFYSSAQWRDAGP